jgi:hypothetical protein
MKIKDILGEDGAIETGTVAGDPKDGKVAVKTANGETTLDQSQIKTDPATGKLTAEVPKTTTGSQIALKTVDQATSEAAGEDEHPSHAHFHDWMNSEYAPHDSDSGDENKVHFKALKFLHSRGVHPGDMEYHASHMARKFHSGMDEESSVFSSRNPGTPAAADAAAQASAPQQPHQSVMPSRNQPTQEGHKDLISQGNKDVGGDATDRFINQVRDKGFERANRGPASSSASTIGGKKLKESDELYKWLTIAGLK